MLSHGLGKSKLLKLRRCRSYQRAEHLQKRDPPANHVRGRGDCWQEQYVASKKLRELALQLDRDGTVCGYACDDSEAYRRA
jgi:hypothetical protein